RFSPALRSGREWWSKYQDILRLRDGATRRRWNLGLGQLRRSRSSPGRDPPRWTQSPEGSTSKSRPAWEAERSRQLRPATSPLLLQPNSWWLHRRWSYRLQSALWDD